MTELEGASRDVSNESGETPTMNALASMVQSVVQEMKAMNRRMDQLSEPVNLEDEDLDCEEGELEHGDADRESIVSLDTKVSELTKACEAGNNKSKSTSALHDICQDLDLSEKTGSAVDEELAHIVNSLLKDKIPDEKTQAKVDQYPKPANIEGLRTPLVNPLIWSQLPAQVRTQDSKHQKSQNSPTEQKVLKTLKSCKKLKAKQNPLISEVAGVIGILVSNFPGTQFGQLYYRSLEHDKTNALICSKGNYNAHMKLSSRSMIELDWWISNMPFACKNIQPLKANIQLQTDASNKGWGAVYGDQQIGGRWNTNEAMDHVNILRA